jgi:hypothetical protein
MREAALLPRKNPTQFVPSASITTEADRLPPQTLVGNNRWPALRGRLDFSSAIPKDILGAGCLCSGEACSKQGEAGRY